MVREITVDLETMEWFLKDHIQRYYKRVLMNELKSVLEEGFKKNFERPHSETYKIETKAELVELIRQGSQHRPKQPRPGAQYNPEYLEKKEKLGEYSPHKFLEYGFYHGTKIYPTAVRLVMKTEPIYKKGFDYLSFHEQNRSVLKMSFLNSWQDIINKIIETTVEVLT